MKKSLLSLLMFTLLSGMLSGQRYLEPVFDEVEVNTAIYGKNYTVLAVPSLGHTVGQPLVADVYQPKGDTETKRPLVIYFHAGNFLPFPQNTSPSGTRKDSTAVDFSTKFAKMGYVCASADYRLGWNPVATTQEARVNTLINAAYRGVQDARTAIRYFKANASLYNIDTTKIMLFGQGTGGYITLATATLDKYSEVLTATNPQNKFIGSNMLPYVIEKIPLPTGGVLYINGDIEAKQLGLVPPNADGTPNPGPPPTGDTLCFPNHINHTSSFQLAVNMGGALGDISWLDQNSVPIISIQAPYDPFAPYGDAVLFVPIPGGQLPVVQVQGSSLIQAKMDDLGLSTPFKALTAAADPIGTSIKAKQNGSINLFPIYGTNIPLDSSPWDFWSPQNVNHANGLMTNADMSAEKGRRYIDSVLMFVAPRACIGLDLPCKADVISGTNDLLDSDVSLVMAPNPASEAVNITTSVDAPIQGVNVYNVSGTLIYKINNINSSTYTLQRGSLNNGVYIVQLQFEKGILSKRIIFN